ncbi:MAG: hypothetical protein V1921_06650 [Candidatus Altiarchaeota archaeon]
MTGTKVVKLKLEGGSGEKLPTLKDPTVEKAAELFKKSELGDSVPLFFEQMVKKTKNLNASSAQLQAIILLMEEECYNKSSYPPLAGMFLTALINNSKTDNFEFELKKPVDSLGYQLEDGKEITVTANLGDWLGEQMTGGKINVRGYARHHVGAEMRGGEIHVDGTIKDYAADRMTGGRIHVGEIRGEYTGHYMDGGTLESDGSLGQISPKYIKGDLFQDGEKFTVLKI